MGRRGSGEYGTHVQAKERASAAKDAAVNLARKAQGVAESFRTTHGPKKHNPSKAEVRRELAHRKYPYSNSVVVASIVVLGLFVCASIYWIVVGLAPPA